MFAFIELVINSYLEPIIALLIALICLLGGYVVYRNAFQKDEDAPEIDLGPLEAKLETLLLNNKGAVAAGGEGVPEEVLKELEEKKQEIERLKADAEGGGPTPEMLAKIKDLEDRLAEYEIIEDDIADLSKFKEENARLKRQLETLSSSGGGVPADSSDGEEEVYTLDESKSEPAAEEPAEAEAAATETEVSMSEADAAVADALNSLDESETAELEAASGVESAPEEAPAEETPAAEPEEPAAEVASTEDETLNDLGAEAIGDEDVPDSAAAESEAVEAAPEEEPAAEDVDKTAPEASDSVLADMTDDGEVDEDADPLEALGDVDTDKMLSEIEDLADDEEATEEVLNEKADLDKMAEEAKKSGD